jgi:hypothetical protein
MPAAITTAAATRRVPKRSFRKTIPISAAKVTLVALTDPARCLAGATWLLFPLPGRVWLGMVAGQAVADVVWYGAEPSVRRARVTRHLSPPDPAHACPAAASCGTMGW